MKGGRIFMLSLVVLGLTAGGGRMASAGSGCTNCGLVSNESTTTRDEIEDHHEDLREHMTDEFDAQENFFKDILERFYIPSLINFTHEMTVAAMQQMATVGGFFDAKQQLTAQRALQIDTAATHRRYEASAGMCRFGTATKTLAASSRLSETSTQALHQWALARELGNIRSSGAMGESADRENRYKQLRGRYCSRAENNDGLNLLCQVSSPTRTINRDADYSRTIDSRWTLDMDLTDTQMGEDEQDVIALASNLYSHRVNLRIADPLLQDATNRQKILDQQALAAKRSVAENSFFTIAGMKAKSESVAEPVGADNRYMVAVIKGLGMTNTDEIQELLGEHPSYYAQMEILTKKLYQDPKFYASLYDTPANVQRQRTSMQAVGLMQDYDTLMSYLRTEMMLSLILEMEVSRLQSDVQRKIDNAVTSGVTL